MRIAQLYRAIRARRDDVPPFFSESSEPTSRVASRIFFFSRDECKFRYKLALARRFIFVGRRAPSVTHGARLAREHGRKARKVSQLYKQPATGACIFVVR